MLLLRFSLRSSSSQTVSGRAIGRHRYSCDGAEHFLTTFLASHPYVAGPQPRLSHPRLRHHHGARLVAPTARARIRTDSASRNSTSCRSLPCPATPRLKAPAKVPLSGCFFFCWVSRSGSNVAGRRNAALRNRRSVSHVVGKAEFLRRGRRCSSGRRRPRRGVRQDTKRRRVAAAASSAQQPTVRLRSLLHERR